MDINNYLPALESKLGEFATVAEWAPGVYYLASSGEPPFLQEYFAVLDDTPLAAKVQNYGEKIDGLRLFAQADDASGWRIVQYEISKYSITVKGEHTPEPLFRDMSLHAMELHPEYFGTFPVPFHTPHGCTLRHLTLSNGIYWLETSMCRELLAICHPIWNAELSFAAQMRCETPVKILAGIQELAADYIFFSKEVSCIPIYELMETRPEWDGTVIHRPALMNAVWEYMPKYALHVNGEKDPEFEFEMTVLMPDPGMKPLPDPDGKHLIGMYPDAGTDFLLLK